MSNSRPLRFSLLCEGSVHSGPGVNFSLSRDSMRTGLESVKLRCC
jgi:hypothetical protein